MTEQLHITDANAGRRLEGVARAWLTCVPRTRLLKWLRKGSLRLNGQRAAPAQRLVAGDVLRLNFCLPALAPAPEGSPPPACGAGPWEASRAGQAASRPRRRLPPPEVLYEDADVLVLNKPAGLASHPGPLHQQDALSARLAQYLHAQTSAPATASADPQFAVGQRPGLAQRLDAGVTGLVPCGKHARALKWLMGPPHGPALQKTYLAWVAGVPAADAGTVRLPLRVTDAPRGDVPKTVVDRVAGKPAVTHWRVLLRFRQHALLAVTLETGRTHQIRAHLRAVGHPLVGDPRYGLCATNAWARQTYGVARPLLHATRLIFTPPGRAAAICIEAPLPADMARLCGGSQLPPWDAPVRAAEAPGARPI